MKNNLTYLFLLCSLSAFGQEITKDSSFVELLNGKYYQTRHIERENGNVEITKSFMGSGTAADAFSVILQGMRSQVRTMASDAAFVSLLPKQLSEITRQNAAIKTLIGKSPLDSIQAKDIATYLVTGWTIKTNGVQAAADVVFTVTAGGQMRHNLGNTPRNVTYFGDAMRLHNFPSTGIVTDFFRLQNGNFVTLDRAYILRKPGSAQQSAPRSTKKRQ